MPLQFKVNPYKGYSNSPYLLIEHPYPEKLFKHGLYTRTEDGLYWFQDPKTGFTHFLAHGGDLEHLGGNLYQTTQDEGFGGHCFQLNVRDLGVVILRGPWSSGCYAANQYLPLPASEVTLTEKKSGGLRSCALTLEKINAIFEKANLKWRCQLVSTRSSEMSPELLYDGKRKKEWEAETLDSLDADWRSAEYYTIDFSLL